MTDSQLTTPQFLPGSTPGAQLRHAREAAGLALPAISEALHLTVHYIKALENDEYNKLPGLIFVKGYIRSYARFLKLDVDTLLGSYDRYVQTLPEIKSHTLAGNYTRKRNDQAMLWAGAATVVVVLGIAIGWWAFGGSTEPRRTVQQYTTPIQSKPPATPTGTDSPRTESTPPESAPSDAAPTPAAVQPQPAATAPATPPSASIEATPASSPSTTATAAPAGGRQINLVRDGNDQMQVSFAGNSWIEITDYANTRIYADMLHSGDNLQIKGKAPFDVLLGDARNVKIVFNANPVTISVRSDSTARLTLADNSGRTAAVTR
jgi:cytoskeleton protein RodZ